MSTIIWEPLAFKYQLVDDSPSRLEIVTKRPTKVEIDETKRVIQQKSVLPKNMSMMLTYECNLGCDYCYLAKQLGKGSPNLDPQTGIYAIDAFKKWVLEHEDYRGEDLRIYLFGGEPGLAREKLLALLGHIASQDKLQPLLFTNGYTLDAQILDLVKGSNGNVVVSIDGPPWLSNQTRKVVKPGSNEGVEERIALLSEQEVDWEIDLVLSPLVLEHLDEVVSYCRDFNPSFIAANVMTRFSGRYTEHDSISLVDYTELLLGMFDAIVGNSIRIHQIWPQYTSFLARKPNDQYMCEMVGGKTMLDTTGAWLPCESFAASDTSLSMVEDYAAMAIDLKVKHPVFHDSCHTCHSLGICGGGCSYLSREEGNGLTGIDSATCHFNRRFGEELIRKAVTDGCRP